MPVSIKGSGGGSVTLDAGAAAADTTLTLPNTSGTILQSGTAVTAAQGGTGLTSPGTAGNVLTSTGSAWASSAPASSVPTPSAIGQVPFSTDGSTWSSTQKIVRGTSTSASGTTVTFTGIPSWVKRITLIVNALTTNGSSIGVCQVGSGSITTTGYLGTGSGQANGGTGLTVLVTAGFALGPDHASSYVQYGRIEIVNISGNIWVASGFGGQSDTARWWGCGGSISLSGVLDRIAISTVNGTDSYNGGTVNIYYE